MKNQSKYDYYVIKLEQLSICMNNSNKIPQDDIAVFKQLQNCLKLNRTLNRIQMIEANKLFYKYGGQQ